MAANQPPRSWLDRTFDQAWRLAGLALVALLFGINLWLRPRPDFEAFSPVVFWFVVLLLGVALLLGSRKLLRGATSPVAAGARAPWDTLAFFTLPALVALLAPLGAAEAMHTSSELGVQASAAFGNPFACFTYGAALVVPFLLLAWLFERRELVPVGALLLAGAVSGVAANLLLHAHCPSAHLGHLLLGHASIGLAWSLGLALFSGRLQRAA